jgi:hypothetical protein
MRYMQFDKPFKPSVPVEVDLSQFPDLVERYGEERVRNALRDVETIPYAKYVEEGGAAKRIPWWQVWKRWRL